MMLPVPPRGVLRRWRIQAVTVAGVIMCVVVVAFLACLGIRLACLSPAQVSSVADIMLRP